MGNLIRIQRIYAQVPRIACKGLCSESCGPIQMSKIEYKRLGEPPAAMTCTLLVNGRCTNYENRPLICRLWGVVEDMPCPFGCVPEGGYIDGRRLLREMERVDPDIRPTHAEILSLFEAELAKEGR